MARLTKPQLLGLVEEGFQHGGWNVLYLTRQDEHPARYRVYRDDRSITVRVYIWNISHGGGPRSASEFRIQITGLIDNRFLPEIGGKTLILGWSDEDQVFAGFDYRRHSGELGGSPSMQIGLTALQAAATNRFAAHLKTNGELAVAFRPEFIGTYAENLEALHDTGQVPAEVTLLERVAAGPANVLPGQIEGEIAEPRQWAVFETRRALRALDFSDRVLKAYGHSCAICSVQLRLLDGAHILPVAETESTDETSNGIALCALHHRAYDRGLITFDSDYQVHSNEKRFDELREAKLIDGYRDFLDRLVKEVVVPSKVSDRPRRDFVERANSLRGWQL
jgi:putative restriction endonuclease